MVWALTVEALAFKGSTLLNPDFRDIISALHAERVELSHKHLIVNKRAVGRCRESGKQTVLFLDSLRKAHSCEAARLCSRGR